MQTGTIKWFSPVKGYGFITREGGVDVFLHSSCLALGQDRHLFPGDVIEFEEVEGDRGPKAANARRLETAGTTSSGGDAEHFAQGG